MKTWASILLLLVAASTVLAQSQAGQSPPAKMQALNFLTGTWQGQGWIAAGASRRHLMVYQTEQVQYKLEGNLLLIEAATYASPDKSHLIITTLTIITYDAAKGNYDWRVYHATQAGMRETDAEASVKDGVLVWTIKNSSTVTQYTASLNQQKQLSVVGKLSQDGGKTWNQSFEMTLDKQSE